MAGPRWPETRDVELSVGIVRESKGLFRGGSEKGIAHRAWRKGDGLVKLKTKLVRSGTGPTIKNQLPLLVRKEKEGEAAYCAAGEKETSKRR